MVECTPIIQGQVTNKLLAHDPGPFIISLPYIYDHPHPSGSRQFVPTRVARRWSTLSIDTYYIHTQMYSNIKLMYAIHADQLFGSHKRQK